jgi:exodeoxyribonuclease X
LFIFLDTETTGIDDDDRLCQLAYKIEDRHTVNEFFNPRTDITIDAMCVHHITNEMVSQKPYFKGSPVAKKLQILLNDPENYLVAHNAKFDVEMLNREGISTERVICTLKIARYLDPEGKIPKYNLQYLRYFLKFNIKAPAHDALGDISVLELLFQRLLTGIKKIKNDDKDLAVQAMVEISKKPSLLVRMFFGKHKGEFFKDIPKDYLKWLAGQDDLDEDLEYTINYYLK